MEEDNNKNTEVNELNSQDQSKGYSISSLVLGLVGILIFALPCGILAVIFGLKGRNKGGRGMATAGFILGIADLACWLLLMIFQTGSMISSLF